MSRQINWEQPLSDKDREWASQFPLMAPLIESNDAEFRAKDSGSLAGEDLDDDPEPVDYSRWLVADLQDELKSRGLNTSGKQAELAARLAEDDAAKA